jgi:hypothetical protein
MNKIVYLYKICKINPHNGTYHLTVADSQIFYEPHLTRGLYYTTINLEGLRKITRNQRMIGSGWSAEPRNAETLF